MNGVTHFTSLKLGNQVNYAMELVRQGKLVCDKQEHFWIDTHSFKSLEVLTKGIDTKASITYELKISVTGNVIAVSMDPPCPGVVVINGEAKSLSLDNPGVLFIAPAGTYPVLFTPVDTAMSPVTSSVTVNN